MSTKYILIQSTPMQVGENMFLFYKECNRTEDREHKIYLLFVQYINVVDILFLELIVYLFVCQNSVKLML